MTKELSVIGRRLPLKDAEDKVAGRVQYAVDFSVARMLHAKVLRSPYPHARIVNIDTSIAEMLPGVEAIITHKDVPKEEWMDQGGSYKGRVLNEIVRFVGDEVAAVAAITKPIAEEALKLIKVEYEQLPHVFDVEEAMKPDSPQVIPDGNVRRPTYFEWGDIEKGFEESDVVLSVLLIERETENVTDSVSTSLVAPTATALPPTWPGIPGEPGTTGFDWSSLLMMMFPIMMLGVVASSVRPSKEKEEVALPAREERKLLPPGREE